MKSILLIILFLLTCLDQKSIAQATFQRTYGGINAEVANSVQQTFDGGYILAGNTWSYAPPAGGNGYLVRTDANGDTLWMKFFGGMKTEVFYSVQQTADSGFIVCGETTSFKIDTVNLNYDLYLMKLDKNGIVIWTRTIGEIGTDFGNSVKQTSDGGYIVTGRYTDNFYNTSVHLVKIDSAGNVVWSKFHSGSFSTSEIGNSIEEISGGGYIITGKTNAFGAGSYDIFLMKTDASGNIVWSKTYGSNLVEDGRCVKQTDDGGFIVVGATNGFSLPGNTNDVYLIKTDSAGNLLWSKLYGTPYDDYGNSIEQTSDGGYIIGGYSRISNGGQYHAYMIKTKPNGDTLWTRLYGMMCISKGYCVHQTTDGGYVLSGEICGGGEGANPYMDMYLLKTDSNGYSGCSESSVATLVYDDTTLVSNAPFVTMTGGIDSACVNTSGNAGNAVIICLHAMSNVGIDETDKNSTIRIFPNPFASELIIENTKADEECYLKDISGKIIFQQKLQHGQTIINTSSVQPGFYILQFNEKYKKNNFKLLKY